jgi:hypothetical protein
MTQTPVLPNTIGPYWDFGLYAPSPQDRKTPVRLAVPYRAFRVAERSDAKVAHYFGIVRPEIARAERLFRGVNRRMKYYDDMDADKRIYAYVWRPKNDVRPVVQLDGMMKIEIREPVPQRVFATLVRFHKEPDAFGVEGQILNWNWMDADSNLCPIDQDDRYDEPVW